MMSSSTLKVVSMGKRTSASYLRALSLAIKRPLKDSSVSQLEIAGPCQTSDRSFLDHQ